MQEPSTPVSTGLNGKSFPVWYEPLRDHISWVSDLERIGFLNGARAAWDAQQVEIAALTAALEGVTERASALLDAYFYYDDDPEEARRLKSAVAVARMALPKRFSAAAQALCCCDRENDAIAALCLETECPKHGD